MRCLECGAEFDEINESQPICPGCGAVPGGCCEREEAGLDIDHPFDTIRTPIDLQEALDDDEALLEATGFATFNLPEGFRFFRLPANRVM